MSVFCLERFVTENARSALAENGKKRYNGKRRYLQISKEEYAVISASIMAKNADAKARGEVIGKSGYTQSANYFYMYENLSDAEFGVIKRIKISNKNFELLSRIRDSLEGANERQSNADRTDSDRYVSSEGIDKGFGGSDVSVDPRGKTAEGNDSILGEQSSQQRGQHNRQGDGTDGGRERVTSAAIGVWARENVPGYDKLADPARTAVRATIRQARALGISEENIKLYASVAARSGLNVVFDVTVKGDALYDGRNTIYVDPAAPVERMRSKLLLHEGGHALFARTRKGRRLLDAAYRAIEKNNPDRAKEIRERYEDHYAGSNLSAEILEGIIKEEQGAAYLEDVLGEVDAWSYILAEEPQYESKLISFFAKAAQDYKHLQGMPAEARKLLRQYKKLFAELSAYNQGNNALDTRPTETKKAVTSMNEENMHDAGERAALSEEQRNNFGWVRENDVLTSGEWKDFEGKFAAALNGQATPQTSLGEYMIAVSDIHDPQLEGINNAIVYVTGTIENPRVSRVLKIDLDNETQLDEQRRNVYALERRGIQQKTGRIFHVDTVTDFRGYGVEQGSSPRVSRHNNEFGTERGGSSGKAEGTAGGLLQSVKTFSDISGKQRKVLQVGREYMIEGDSRSKYSPTIKAAIEAENRRIVKRIAKEYGRTESWVRRMLENDPAFFDKNGAELVRFALPEDSAKKGYTLKELLDGNDDFKPELILRVEADAHLRVTHASMYARI